jgi:hypothetical protein
MIKHIFNTFGDLEQETKDNNEVVSYKYDVVGRLYLIEDATNGDVRYTWDTALNGIGKVAQIDVPSTSVTTAYDYDAAGRLVTKTWTVGQETYAITTMFDAFGRLASITYPQVGSINPFNVSYEYGQFGQLIRVVDAASVAVWSFVGSDASGDFVQTVLGNSLLESFNEDQARPAAWIPLDDRKVQQLPPSIRFG